jgi:hypothetical protein
MKKITFAAVTIVALLASFVSGCGALSAEVTPTPGVVERNYTNIAMGLSMWCPEDWWHEEDEEQVTFATSEEVFRTEQQSGAFMMVESLPLEEQSLEDWYQNEEPLQSSPERWAISDPTPHGISGQDGFIVTFEGTHPYIDLAVKGFLAGAEQEGWGYVFFAISTLDDWPEHGPDLEMMLDSVQLTPRE